MLDTAPTFTPLTETSPAVLLSISSRLTVTFELVFVKLELALGASSVVLAIAFFSTTGEGFQSRAISVLPSTSSVERLSDSATLETALPE